MQIDRVQIALAGRVVKYLYLKMRGADDATASVQAASLNPGELATATRWAQAIETVTNNPGMTVVEMAAKLGARQ